MLQCTCRSCLLSQDKVKGYGCALCCNCIASNGSVGLDAKALVYSQDGESTLLMRYWCTEVMERRWSLLGMRLCNRSRAWLTRHGMGRSLGMQCNRWEVHFITQQSPVLVLVQPLAIFWTGHLPEIAFSLLSHSHSHWTFLKLWVTHLSCFYSSVSSNKDQSCHSVHHP